MQVAKVQSLMQALSTTGRILAVSDNYHYYRNRLSMAQLEEQKCPFCVGALKHSKGRLAYSMPDDSPLTTGHTLVILTRHENNLLAASVEEWSAIWDLTRTIAEKLLGEPGADGMNVGVNIGKSAGQTVGHAHVHIIPRKTGDQLDPTGGIRRILDKSSPRFPGPGRIEQ
jgi:diadenosine tetraphosphate (Ap4A) HIT family hydrolase